MEYEVKGLNFLSNQLHVFQIEAGFTDSNIVQRLMLVHSEISEAFEAFRKDKRALIPSNDLHNVDMERMDGQQYFKTEFEINYKDSLEDEIADAVIRLLAFCGENQIDIEKHIELKMKYNELRGFKFGGKKF